MGTSAFCNGGRPFGHRMAAGTSRGCCGSPVISGETACLQHAPHTEPDEYNTASRPCTDYYMHESNCFASSCPKCRHQQLQRGFSRAVLLRLLSSNDPIEAYCPTCDEFWAISSRERVALLGELKGWGVGDISPQG